MKKNKQMTLPLQRQNPRPKKSYMDTFFEKLETYVIDNTTRQELQLRKAFMKDYTIQLYKDIMSAFMEIVEHETSDIDKFNQFMNRFFQKNQTLFNTLKSDDSLERDITRTLEKIAPVLDNTRPKVKIYALRKQEVVLTYDMPTKVIVSVKPNSMKIEIFENEKRSRKLDPQNSYVEILNFYHKGYTTKRETHISDVLTCFKAYNVEGLTIWVKSSGRGRVTRVLKEYTYIFNYLSHGEQTIVLKCINQYYGHRPSKLVVNLENQPNEEELKKDKILNGLIKINEYVPMHRIYYKYHQMERLKDGDLVFEFADPTMGYVKGQKIYNDNEEIGNTWAYTVSTLLLPEEYSHMRVGISSYYLMSLLFKIQQLVLDKYKRLGIKTIGKKSVVEIENDLNEEIINFNKNAEYKEELIAQPTKLKINPEQYKYMSLDEISPFEPLMAERKVSEVARGVQPSNQTNTGFLVAYKRAKGNKKRIENMPNGFGDQKWGKRRHDFIARHLKQMNNERAFMEDGTPTRRHLGLIAWAFTPYPKEIKQWIKENKLKRNPKETINCAVHRLSSDGVHEKIGNIKVETDKDGVIFHVNVKGIFPYGEHGFHIHEFGDLQPKEKNGNMVAGLSAGSHFDPYNAGFHGSPNGNGHLGDLPKLTADKNGHIKQTVRQNRIKDLQLIKGRSLVIHKFGDNYSDNPLPNGGGKSRYAGAIIENSCRYCEKRNNPTKDQQGYLIPDKYLKGFKGKEREKRIKEIGNRRKQYKHIYSKAEKENRKPTQEELKLIYRPFETDKKEKGAKTKLSPYTQEAHKRGFTGSLKNKQKVASEYYGGDIPYSTLEKIYNKGQGAWASGGHRKYQTPQSWGMARVNSFLVGGKAFFTADNKIARETLPKKVYNKIKKQAVWSVKLNKIIRKNPQIYPKANLINGNKMLDKDWYRPISHYEYFYHSPKQNKIFNSQNVLDTIDIDLYEIVRIAHDKGLSTGSSCQGHFYTVNELKEKYKKAKEDEKQIRDDGLILENVENGEQIIWKQDDYKFPYTQSKFIEIMRDNPKGYLPIYLHDNQCKICDDLDNKGIDYEFDSDNGLLELSVEENTPIQQQLQWITITDVFENHYTNPLKIQTVLFDREKFTINSAIKFLKRNKLNYNKVDIPKTGKYLRFRQFPPNQFIKGSYRTKPFGKEDGVLVIYAQPKDR